MRDINKNTPDKKRKRKAPRRRKAPPAEDVVAPPGPDAPHWIPTDESWQKLPERIREAVPRILAPAYRRFVLDAPGELERSIGLTLMPRISVPGCLPHRFHPNRDPPPVRLARYLEARDRKTANV